jgi:hypothetical protein
MVEAGKQGDGVKAGIIEGEEGGVASHTDFGIGMQIDTDTSSIAPSEKVLPAGDIEQHAFAVGKNHAYPLVIDGSKPEPV